MNCYDAIDLMADALEGELQRAARPGFEEHLDECPSCRTYFVQLKTTVDALEHLPRPGAPGWRRAELIAAFRRQRLGRQ